MENVKIFHLIIFEFIAFGVLSQDFERDSIKLFECAGNHKGTVSKEEIEYHDWLYTNYKSKKDMMARYLVLQVIPSDFRDKEWKTAFKKINREMNKDPFLKKEKMNLWVTHTYLVERENNLLEKLCLEAYSDSIDHLSRFFYCTKEQFELFQLYGDTAIYKIKAKFIDDLVPPSFKAYELTSIEPR